MAGATARGTDATSMASVYAYMKLSKCHHFGSLSGPYSSRYRHSLYSRSGNSKMADTPRDAEPAPIASCNESEVTAWSQM